MTSPEAADAVEPNEQKPAKKSSGFAAKAKTALATLLLMALTGGIGYGVGRLQTRSQIQATADAKQATIDDLETQVQQAETQAETAAARSQLNEVRFLLLRSVNELNANNFGNAGTQLRQASETLNGVAIAQNPDQLETLKQELAEQEINFAINPAEQRRILLDYANRVTALLPK